jgi:putrescine aminotransferase
MSEYRGAVLQEASRILDYILKEELSEEEKDRVIHDSIENFNEHVNPGWLKYRKSVSTDAAFVEWEDSQETLFYLHR